jgi:hypothetical protein
VVAFSILHNAYGNKLKKKGLAVSYEEKPIVKEWCKKLAALAFVPQQLMRLAWQIIIEELRNIPYEDFDKCYGLLLYFNAVWFTTYPISVWNHYETVGPRTNNHVEGFHSKLNKISGKRPNIYRSINVFKEIETETTIDYNQRILPNGRLPTRRRREDIRRDCDIEFLSQQLKYSQINLRAYVTDVSKLFNYQQ